jgi:HSP20 family protein
MNMQSQLPQAWSRNGLTEHQRDPFKMMQHEMNRLFDTWGDYPAGHQSGGLMPRLDICETEKELAIDADLPGFDNKSVEVAVSGDVLTIRGERKNGHEGNGKNYHVTERSWGEFTRQVNLPFEADPKKIEAKFEKGVLHIAIAKPEGVTAKVARIPVRAA